MQSQKGFAKGFLLFVVIYGILASLMYWVVRDDWQRTAVSTDTVNRDALLPELAAGDEIDQDFEISADSLQLITLYANLRPGVSPDSQLIVSFSSEGQVLGEKKISYGEVKPDGELVISMDKISFPAKGTIATATLQAEGGISLWYGSSKTAGKFQVNVETSGLRVSGEPVEGELVLIQKGELFLPYTNYFWPIAIGIFLVVSAIILYCHYCRRKEKANKINKGIDLIKQYKYLLKTLVVRDFKIKYKASMLGVLWSFLNPLLMTFVYMFVFSTLFRSSIENFVVYLMSGIILFNYFSESSNLGMQSIVGNAGLITKVYMPKYILPISKVLSSAINLIISLIPLLIMMAITGVRFSKSLLLIPVVLIFLILFCVGVSLILAAAMVYFRDVQFLWGIFLTVLNFLSPIFYPETIIPARFITLYHMNPMYQYLFFMRTITIGGISPTPVTYLYCMLASLGTLAVGLFIFRKCQSQFVLHL
ncbi:MAG: ABC transporter permease [Clostridia bacterium]|nr:ABC transporter permease [Clostridia bacterium]